MIDAEAIRAAFAFRGTVAVRAHVLARSLTFFVDPDWDQVARRREHHIGALVDRSVLNALWEIPADLDYPPSALPAWVLERLAGRHLIRTHDGVRRDLNPPLRVHGAVATGRNLRRLLLDLGSFSAVCPTAALLTGSGPAPDDPDLLDARLFGVGVGISGADGITVLTEPREVEGEAGPYQWHLSEVLYAEFERAAS